MPTTAAKMAAALGMESRFASATIADVSNWGDIPIGTAIRLGSPLFPRVEKKVEAAPVVCKEAKAKKAQEVTPAEGLISFDQFKGLELRVAEVVAAEKVAKSDRLLKLTVKAPEERTIVAGIALHYAPEELLGKKVLIVANLKPAKLMGIPSQGMVLAAKQQLEDGSEKLVVTTVAGDIAAGSRVA